MKVTRFRIRHYKSIIDSGDCFPSDGVTILAGKNEAGKSSILGALADFNLETGINERAIPIEDPDEQPVIEIAFRVSKEEVEKIFSEADFVAESSVPDFVTILARKLYPDEYELECDHFGPWGLLKPHNFEGAIGETYGVISTATISDALTTIGLPLFNKLDVADAEKQAAARSVVSAYKAKLTPKLESLAEAERKQLVAGLDKLIALLGDAIQGRLPAMEAFQSEFLNAMPNFILFSSFDDVFPNTIALPELAKNKWIRDLQRMSDIDVPIITGSNDRAKVTHKTKLNTNLNQDFKQFWTQDASSLAIEWDNQKLSFWIEENTHYYEPEIRSQGRRWHLAFYIRVSARAREDTLNVILIDEPGLYLHAKAQRDILKNLEKAGGTAQVIFSTHSPYLIETDKLERIRLVEKLGEKGTVIQNKIHAASDKETLTPILTAIGLELNQGISNVDRIDNVIVEGASDYYYLNAFREILGAKGPNFISGGGAGNMPFVGTILQGWGCKVVYLYDSDQGYKDATKNLKSKWVTITKEQLSKIPVDGGIEDVFSKNDFLKVVLEEPPAAIEGRNSDYMKGKDKVLTAKRWLEAVRSGKRRELSKETKEAATKLMTNLTEILTKPE